MVIDYAIQMEDFLEYESEILLSGCLPELMLPKIYRHHESMYLVYECDCVNSSTLADDLSDYDEEEIERIAHKARLFMLRPENIVFHPSRIYRMEGKWRYHYLPTRRKPLYEAADLRRYLMLGELNGDHPPECKGVGAKHALFFKEDGHVEKLFLKKTSIGKQETNNIVIDFDGQAVIDHLSGLTAVSGEVRLNHVLLTPHCQQRLKRGDILKFGAKEAVYI